MIRVAAVDDHPLFLDGVVQTLRTAPDIDLVASGTSANDAIRIGHAMAPDVLVLDMCMPAATDGIAVVEALAASAPSVRIVMLTVVADDDRVAEAVRKGAKGYVLKGVSGAELVRIVRAVHGGETCLAPSLAARLIDRLVRPASTTKPATPISARLGTREDQILALIVKGYSNKEIGRWLALSDKTVKHYITGLLTKLQVRNRTEAAVIAAQWPPRQPNGPHAG